MQRNAMWVSMVTSSTIENGTRTRFHERSSALPRGVSALRRSNTITRSIRCAIWRAIVRGAMRARVRRARPRIQIRRTSSDLTMPVPFWVAVMVTGVGAVTGVVTTLNHPTDWSPRAKNSDGTDSTAGSLLVSSERPPLPWSPDSVRMPLAGWPPGSGAGVTETRLVAGDGLPPPPPPL